MKISKARMWANAKRDGRAATGVDLEAYRRRLWRRMAAVAGTKTQLPAASW